MNFCKHVISGDSHEGRFKLGGETRLTGEISLTDLNSNLIPEISLHGCALQIEIKSLISRVCFSSAISIRARQFALSGAPRERTART